MQKRRFVTLIILLCFIFNPLFVIAEQTKYPDYAYEYLGPDKHEKYNRKMFSFNMKLNKYAIKPVHILWATIVPQYGMDRIFCFSNNIEYPIRLVSSLLQRDFTNAKNETKRFLVNTTIGLAGLYDPAKRILHIERSKDNMDKALARCNIKPGAYFVAPIISFTTVRGLFGRVLDMALNPTTYIGTPILAVIKACITINRTSYIQSLLQLVESNFADPYEIHKKAFGISGYIFKNNFDRVDVLSDMKTPKTSLAQEETDAKILKPVNNLNPQLKVSAKIIKGNVSDKDKKQMTNIIDTELGLDKVSIEPNIILENYYPQSPLVDSMRTSLFSFPEVTESIWNEMSPWNRSFANRLKYASVNVFEGRDDYSFRYMLQKDKNAPLAVIYPSTGDGVKASHPMMFAKMFYDAGFSVIIHGNPFQWEFVKSMPKGYCPGLPARDAKLMRASTAKIIEKVEKKHNCKFSEKVLLGTSLAALDLLFIAEQESKENTLGETKYIVLCPPVDLLYSLKTVDDITDGWHECSDELKDLVAFTSAKIVKLYQSKSDINFEIKSLPFTDEEARLITGFMMHQKLSDVIFTIENAPKNKPSGIYNKIYNMGYSDYMEQYIMQDESAFANELNHGFGLVAISDYLENADNYKIYHTLNDYLITTVQLKQLKRMAGDKLVILDNGSHMGFLYRREFLQSLKNTISEML